MRKLISAIGIFVLATGFSVQSRADTPVPAAYLSELDGKVIAVAGAKVRTLAQNDALFAGDTIATLGPARALLRFVDQSKYELGADTRFVIREYRYTAGAADNTAATEVVKGLFRYVSGLLAKARPNAISIRTAVATIGIRGTHIVGEVTETSARIGLLEPEEGDAPSSISVANAFGEVVIAQPGYATEIPDAHSPPSPPRPMDLRTMTRNLRAVQTMRRVIAPRIPTLH